MTGNGAHIRAEVRHMDIDPPRFQTEDDTPLPCETIYQIEDVFFSPDDGTERKSTVGRAREHSARVTCASCPFIVECALHGLRHEDYGVWGGLSEIDRKILGGRALGVRTGAGGLKAVLTRLSNAGVSLGAAMEILRRWRREQTREAA